MNKERLSFDEKIVWILTVLIYFFYVYEKRKILFPVEHFQKYGLLFDGYVFLSCLWAWDRRAERKRMLKRPF